MPVEDARHFGVLAVGDGGRIERFVEKPQTVAELPGAADDAVLASMGIYVFDADFLASVLALDAARPRLGAARRPIAGMPPRSMAKHASATHN